MECSIVYSCVVLLLFLSSQFAYVVKDRLFTNKYCLWNVLPHCKAGTGAIVGNMPSTTPCTPGPGLSTACPDRTSP